MNSDWKTWRRVRDMNTLALMVVILVTILTCTGAHYMWEMSLPAGNLNRIAVQSFSDLWFWFTSIFTTTTIIVVSWRLAS